MTNNNLKNCNGKVMSINEQNNITTQIYNFFDMNST